MTSPPHPPLVQLLDPDGVRHEVEGVPLDLKDENLRTLWRRMVVARRMERQAVTLTRQGALAVYPSATGQEAAEVGATAAMGPADWLFPTYRDTVAVVERGVDPVAAFALFKGAWHCGWDVPAARVAPHATPIATHALHAVGLAMAARKAGDDVVAVAFLGDGATSEGDAHEAWNLAAVFDVPCVFFVQNNQYAISVPVAKQTRASTIAAKAVGYGMPGVRCDGNDVLATYAVVRAAVDRARRGEGPTLVEAVTYRVDAHTTADDAGRYRSDAELEAWRPRDPVARLERHLEREGLLDADDRAEAGAEAERLAARLRAELGRDVEADPMELFDHVYVEEPGSFRAQREQLRGELAASR